MGPAFFRVGLRATRPGSGADRRKRFGRRRPRARECAAFSGGSCCLRGTLSNRQRRIRCWRTRRKSRRGRDPAVTHEGASRRRLAPGIRSRGEAGRRFRSPAWAIGMARRGNLSPPSGMGRVWAEPAEGSADPLGAVEWQAEGEPSLASLSGQCKGLSGGVSYQQSREVTFQARRARGSAPHAWKRGPRQRLAFGTQYLSQAGPGARLAKGSDGSLGPLEWPGEGARPWRVPAFRQWAAPGLACLSAHSRGPSA